MRTNFDNQILYLVFGNVMNENPRCNLSHCDAFCKKIDIPPTTEKKYQKELSIRPLSIRTSIYNIVDVHILRDIYFGN